VNTDLGYGRTSRNADSAAHADDARSFTNRDVRYQNDRLVLGALLNHGPLTASDLAELTGISRVTAHRAVRALLEREFIQRISLRPPTYGRPAVVYDLRQRYTRAVGVHFASGYSAASCADVNGVSLAQVTGDVDADSDPVQAVGELVDRASTAAGLEPGTVRQVVVGVSRTSPYAASQRPDARWDFSRRLGQRLGANVQVATGLSLAAMAEATVGAGVGVADFMVLSGDPELAMCAVRDGVPYEGATGNAGVLHRLPQVVGAMRAAKACARSAPEAGTDLVSMVAIACLVDDPSMIILQDDLLGAGGSGLIDRLCAGISAVVGRAPQIRPSTVEGDPVLRGAAIAAARAARKALIDMAEG
jgi:DNA-binding Lrp family transcriptional regulator